MFFKDFSHALDQNRAAVNFVGIYDLTHDHLDYHRIKIILSPKKFFQMLSKDAFALSNTDDSMEKKMLGD
jgi:hypothetical protein